MGALRDPRITSPRVPCFLLNFGSQNRKGTQVPNTDSFPVFSINLCFRGQLVSFTGYDAS